MGEMTFKITRMVQKTKENETKSANKLVKLPESHTCFNQLVLPGELITNYKTFWPILLKYFLFLDYKDKETLKKKLTIAISNAEGFGLE